MSFVDDILPLVEKPSRYLGSEVNTVKKDPSDVKLNMVLAFPDLYEIGTSHFGLQIIYDILNREPDIAAERTYAPASDMELLLRDGGDPLFSLESHTPLARFDIIGFSLLYELNFTNILTMLDLSGVPFYAADRDDSHPLIIAGGPCTVNPEPLADFFDVILIGDGEETILKVARAWISWRSGGDGKKRSFFKDIAEIQGVYIPSFFEPTFEEDAQGNVFQTLLPLIPQTVKRAVVPNLDYAPFPESPVVAFGRPIHDRLRLEVSRGCSRGCRFCQAGMIYRPVRERSVKNLMEIAEKSLATTGYEDISLLSLSTGDYGCIAPLMENLMTRYESQHTAISLPSIRAGRLTPELMNQIKRVRKTGFTIAPEAGTQRLRDVINKGITEEEIIDTVTNAFTLGWQVIKLYFMVGHPTETQEDLEGIVTLVDTLRKIKGPGGRKGKINVSVTTFIPKSHTPFQWASQMTLEESTEKMYWLKDKLRLSGVQFKWQTPQTSILEGLWARGDRRLASLLVRAYRNGCRFDGWSEHFNFSLWKKSIEEEGLDIDFFTTRKRTVNEPLPWDHVDTGVSKSFLKDEWEKSVVAQLTPDCRYGECSGCGVCDFESIKPVAFDDYDEQDTFSKKTDNVDCFLKLKVAFSKRGQAKYFGHLELVSIVQRAVRRAKIPVKYSQGFHPMMKISFDDPLPLGMESLGENFFITVPEYVKPREIISGLNDHLPHGLKVLDCFIAPGKKSKALPSPKRYTVRLGNGSSFDQAKLSDYAAMDECMMSKTNKKGRVKKIDLKEAVINLTILDDGALSMELGSEPGKTVRPSEVMSLIFGLSGDVLKKAAIIKSA